MVIKDGGDIKVKDLTKYGRFISTSFRCIKGKDAPVETGNILNLAKAVAVKIEDMDSNMMKVEFIDEYMKSAQEYEQTELEFDLEEEEEKSVIVGRDGDITIGHSKVSGNHLVMKIGTVTDSSSFGTFVLLKNYEEATTGL